MHGAICCSKRARLMREKASINWPKSCCFLLFEAIFLFWLFKHLSDHLWAKYLDSVLFFRIGETCDKWTEFRLRDKGIFVLLVLHQIWLVWTAALIKNHSFLCKKIQFFKAFLVKHLETDAWSKSLHFIKNGKKCCQIIELPLCERV